MSITPRPPLPSFLPENAPFSPEQRAWLNGLFAGLFGLEGGVTPLSKQDVAKLLPGLVDAPEQTAEEEVDDGAPWHDPAMPLADRMQLAAGRPLPRRLMAAMAQQDCGQCGYNCQDYADVLFSQKEKRLNLCVPGGKETSRMLKQLYQELESGAPRADVAEAEAAPAPRRRARPLARQSGHRHAFIALPAQQGGLREGHLAYRVRSRRQRARLRGRRFLRRVPGQRSRAGRRGDRSAARRRPIFRSAAALCARR